MIRKEWSYTSAIETYLIPASGVYRLEAWGGEGGGTNKSKGAYSRSYISFKKGDEIYILVGQGAGHGKMEMSGSENYSGCGGGGGGTFISKGKQISTSVPLCVAGGGGSQSALLYINNYAHGQATQTGGDPNNRKQDPGSGGLSGSYGSGGGGFYSNGTQGSSLVDSKAGVAFIYGGIGVNLIYNPTAYGGFGGGGAGHGNCGYPVGGGGFSGGSSYGDHHESNGGGGGSYHEGNYCSLKSYSRAGFEKMPSPKDSSDEIGNAGNGYAKLTQMKSVCSHKFYYQIPNILLYSIILKPFY